MNKLVSSAGTNRLNWNTSNYASGIYIYKMNTDKFNKAKKDVTA